MSHAYELLYGTPIITRTWHDLLVSTRASGWTYLSVSLPWDDGRFPDGKAWSSRARVLRVIRAAHSRSADRLPVGNCLRASVSVCKMPASP